MEFDHNTIETLLNLPDIIIDRVVFEQPRTIKVYLRSTSEGTDCHRCGRPIDHGYGVGQELQLRHLLIGEYNIILVIRPKRHQCQHCDGCPTTTQTLSRYHPRASVTKVFEKHMLLELINSTLEDVSRKHQVGVDALQGMLDRCLSREVDWDTIKTLGIFRDRRNFFEKRSSRFCRCDQSEIRESRNVLDLGRYSREIHGGKCCTVGT